MSEESGLMEYFMLCHLSRLPSLRGRRRGEGHGVRRWSCECGRTRHACSNVGMHIVRHGFFTARGSSAVTALPRQSTLYQPWRDLPFSEFGFAAEAVQTLAPQSYGFTTSIYKRTSSQTCMGAREGFATLFSVLRLYLPKIMPRRRALRSLRNCAACSCGTPLRAFTWLRQMSLRCKPRTLARRRRLRCAPQKRHRHSTVTLLASRSRLCHHKLCCAK